MFYSAAGISNSRGKLLSLQKGYHTKQISAAKVKKSKKFDLFLCQCLQMLLKHVYFFFSVFLAPQFDKGHIYHYNYQVIVETSKYGFQPKAAIKIVCEVLVSAPSADTITMKVKLIECFSISSQYK